MDVSIQTTMLQLFAAHPRDGMDSKLTTYNTNNLNTLLNIRNSGNVFRIIRIYGGRNTKEDFFQLFKASHHLVSVRYSPPA